MVVAAMSGRRKRPCGLAAGRSRLSQTRVAQDLEVVARRTHEESLRKVVRILEARRTTLAPLELARETAADTRGKTKTHLVALEAQRTILAPLELARAMAAGIRAQRTLVNPRNSL